MTNHSKIRQSVRELDDSALRQAHAAVVELLSRMDMKRVAAAQEARTNGRIEAAVGAGGAAAIAAGLLGLSFFTFGLTGIAAAGVLAAKAASATGVGTVLQEAGRMADRGLGPKPDAAFLAGYEELVFRKSCLEEELQNRQRSQSHRSEWAKLIDDSRRA